MHKKTKHTTVSDLRLQLAGAHDSPFSRETASEAELGATGGYKLVIDFPAEPRHIGCDVTFASNGDCASWTHDGAYGHGGNNGGHGGEGGALVYEFEESAHVGLCEWGGASYSTSGELALFNNRLGLSLLRLDLDARLHHVRALRRETARPGDVIGASSLFARRFPALLLYTTLQSKVCVEDFEAAKRILEYSAEGITCARAWDALYGLCDERGAVSLYDIRDSAAPVARAETSRRGRRVACTDMARRGHSVLVCTDEGSTLFDMRKSGQLLRHTSLGSFAELDEAQCDTGGSLHCSKAFFSADSQAVVADLARGTLDLHCLSSGALAKSLDFGARLLDVAHCESSNTTAALLRNETNQPEVALLSSTLEVLQVLPLPDKAFRSLGWLGACGRLLAHSRTDFAVLQTDTARRFDRLCE